MGYQKWIAAFVVAALLTSPASAQAQTGALRVNVRVPGTLAPLPDVQISLIGPQSPTRGLLDLPDNEEDLLEYLEELAAQRGIANRSLVVRPGSTRSTSTPCNPPPAFPARIVSPNAITDVEGNATFVNLAAGTYNVRVARDGYIGALPTGSNTAMAPLRPASSVVVEPGGNNTEVSFLLNRASTVSGRVRDSKGVPIENVCVQLGMIKTENGQRLFTAGPSAISDSKGEYRLRSVSSGSFSIRVQPVGSASVIVYFPGSEDPDKATLLSIEAGSNIVGIDFDLP